MTPEEYDEFMKQWRDPKNWKLAEVTEEGVRLVSTLKFDLRFTHAKIEDAPKGDTGVLRFIK